MVTGQLKTVDSKAGLRTHSKCSSALQLSLALLRFPADLISQFPLGLASSGIQKTSLARIHYLPAQTFCASCLAERYVSILPHGPGWKLGEFATHLHRDFPSPCMAELPGKPTPDQTKASFFLLLTDT